MSESVWPFHCAHCGKLGFQPVRYINRAAKNGVRLFCDRACAGLARRVERTDEEKIAAKAANDAEYRIKNRSRLKAEKAAWYQRTADREKEREYRRENMGRHVEYCRRPEYRKKKRIYDRGYRAKQKYGPFAEAFLTLQELETEIAARASRYEIYAQNGLLNKAKERKRGCQLISS